MIRNPFRFYQVPPPPPTYFGGTLPAVDVRSTYPDDYVANAVRQGGSRFFGTAGRFMGQPQRDMMEFFTGKEQTPSEYYGIENPIGAFAVDALTDPVNLIGGATLAKLGGLGMRGITRQGLKDFARRNFRNPFSRFESPVSFEEFEYLEPGVGRSPSVTPPAPPILTRAEAEELLRQYNTARGYSLSNSGGIRNQSGMTRAEAELMDPASAYLIDFMSEDEFRKTVVSMNKNTPTIARAPNQNEVAQYLLDSRVRPIPTDDWINEFNSQLDVLNNQIVPGRNKSGRKYEFGPMERVQGLRDFANIKIKSLDKSGDEVDNVWSVKINPGKFKGKIKDVAGEAYMDAIPGINMVNTADGVFRPSVYAPGSNAYSALNDYLKMLDLGRVKSGKNSLSDKGKKAWQSYLANDRAIGHLYDNQIYAMMRSMNPYLMPMGAGYGIGEYYKQFGRNKNKEMK